jgi:hypothetical protein
MSANVEQRTDGLFVLRIEGELKKSELDAVQCEMAAKLTARPIQLLVILQNFTGWERSEEWGNLEFFLSHQGDFGKIAVVGDPTWEAQALAFTGAGFRKGPVKFFPETGEQDARAWLAELGK